MMTVSEPGGALRERVEFCTTHWSVVLAARDGGVSPAQQALETLCAAYWYPIYSYVRRQGHPPEDAADATQAFFAHLLSHDFLRNVAPEKGRFRSFLLACLKRHLADHWRREHTRKRGPTRALVSLDEAQAEGRYLRESVELADPETLYERRWALTLLDRVLDRLEAEFTAARKPGLFAELQPFLLGEKGGRTYAQIAAHRGSSEGAIKMTVLRMRERLRALFREEIARTVATPAEVDEEIRHLLSVFSASHHGAMAAQPAGTV
jgi:RNA polymerase sigma factor (sigma-70 family)